MKIAVFGLRGMPGVQGGIETHAQCLYPRLVAKGCEVTVLARTCFQPTDIKSYQGVRIVNLPTVRTSGIEALVHSIVAAVYCAFSRPNIVHVHAVGRYPCCGRSALGLFLLIMGRITSARNGAPSAEWFCE